MRKDLDRIGIASYRSRRVYFLASIAYYDDIENEIRSGFHFDEKTYLSEKGRKCSFRSAAEFSNRRDAVNLFDTWINRQIDKHWKLEIVECSEPEDIEFRVYDETHPLFKVESELPRYVHHYARAFYYDYLHQFSYSKSTLLRIRKILLPYGIDIGTRVSENQNLSVKTKALVSELTLGTQKDSGLKIISSRSQSAL